jgi:hypothetical protein
MELSLDLVYTKVLKNVGTSGTYPSKDNCYVVDVYEKETNEFLYTIQYCPKPVFEMWEALRLMVTKYGVRKTDTLLLTRGFNDIGEWKYYEASIDASMNTEDI